MNSDCMLSTIDNPFDPFDQFVPWFMFDIEKGYNSCGLLARIANFTDDLSQTEIDAENERAIDQIIKYDVMNIYKKVSKNGTTEDLSNTT